MRSLNIHFCTCSKKGRRKRNEDYVDVASFHRNHKRITIAAVADGMGGYEGGHIASKLAIRTFFAKIKKHFSTSTDTEYLKDLLMEIYQDINQKLYRKGQTDRKFEDMGTTLTSLVMVDNKYQIAHIGDSRAYIIGNEDITQITEDHSAIAEALKDGLYTAQEIANLPYKNAITRNLGNKDKIKADILPAKDTFEANENQIFLLATDGIYSTVSELELYETVISNRNLKKAARDITELAYIKGSRDNLSVAIMEKGHIPRNQNLISNYLSIRNNKRKKIKLAVLLISTILFSLLLAIMIYMLSH